MPRNADNKTAKDDNGTKRERLFNDTSITNLCKKLTSDKVTYDYVKPHGVTKIELPSSFVITMVHSDSGELTGFKFETQIAGLGKLQSFDCKSSKFANRVLAVITNKIVAEHMESQGF